MRFSWICISVFCFLASERCCKHGCGGQCFFPFLYGIKVPLDRYIASTCLPMNNASEAATAAACIMENIGASPYETASVCYDLFLKLKGRCKSKCLFVAHSVSMTDREKWFGLRHVCGLTSATLIFPRLIQRKFKSESFWTNHVENKIAKVKKFDVHVDQVVSVCCFKANLTPRCRDVCLKQDMLFDVGRRKEEPNLFNCFHDNSELHSCILEGKSVCQPGCHPYRTPFCADFVNPLGYYKACDRWLDKEARHMVELWKETVPLHTTRCREEDFKRMACNMVLKPCSLNRELYSHSVCKTDYEHFLDDSCLKSVPSANLDNLFFSVEEPSISSTNCISPKSKSSNMGQLSLDLSVVYPCSGKTCERGETCRINPDCTEPKRQKKCKGNHYRCVPGCSTSNGQTQVGIGETIRIPEHLLKKLASQVKIQWKDFVCKEDGFLKKTNFGPHWNTFDPMIKDKCHQVSQKKEKYPMLLVEWTLSAVDVENEGVSRLRTSILRHLMTGVCFLTVTRVSVDRVVFAKIQLIPNGLENTKWICSRELERIYVSWSKGSLWFAADPVLGRLESCLTFVDGSGEPVLNQENPSERSNSTALQVLCVLCLVLVGFVGVLFCYCYCFDKKRRWNTTKEIGSRKTESTTESESEPIYMNIPDLQR